MRFRPLIGVIISKLANPMLNTDEYSFRPLIGVIISKQIPFNPLRACDQLFPSPYRGYYF